MATMDETGSRVQEGVSSTGTIKDDIRSKAISHMIVDPRHRKPWPLPVLMRALAMACSYKNLDKVYAAHGITIDKNSNSKKPKYVFDQGVLERYPLRSETNNLRTMLLPRRRLIKKTHWSYDKLKSSKTKPDDDDKDDAVKKMNLQSNDQDMCHS